jgi:hypothetical protein
MKFIAGWQGGCTLQDAGRMVAIAATIEVATARAEELILAG